MPLETHQRPSYEFSVGEGEGCALHLDDVVVYLTNGKHTQKVFDCLADAQLTVNLAKREFAQASRVSRAGSRSGCPVRAKVQPVENYEPPTTTKELI